MNTNIKGDRDRMLVKGGGTESSGPQLLRGLLHQHQLDAWNSDLVSGAVKSYLLRISLKNGKIVNKIQN